MIVPMRKLSLLIFYRDYQAFLGELREKGVVHIHENKKRSAEDEELKHKFAVIKRIGEMIKQLSKRIPETKETFTELLERRANLPKVHRSYLLFPAKQSVDRYVPFV